jgi:two-component sensor histidine kinase
MLRKAWNCISTIGVKDEYDEILVNKIVLINQFSTISIVLFFFSGLNYFLIGEVFSSIIIESLSIFSVLTIYLNKLACHKFSVTFLFVILSFVVFYFDSYSGVMSGTFLYFFPLILALTFIFSMKEDMKSLFVHFLFVILLISINFFTEHKLFESSAINDSMRKNIFMFNLILSSSAVGFFVYLMIQNNIKQSYRYAQHLYEIQNAEEQLKLALNEKNILLSELHHRVKNNLAIISGLFSLKLNDDLPNDSKSILIESRNRVRSIALIHNKLYKSDSLENLSFGTYALDLISEITSSYLDVNKNITVKSNIHNINLSVKHAIPCGLILNELLTNCYKHAFPNSTNGTIHVDFIKCPQTSLYKLIVVDDGVGLPDNYNKKQSLGQTVIESLCEQIDGQFLYKNNNGTHFELTFKPL